MVSTSVSPGFFKEDYLFRRNICDIPTNALNKIFLLLHREITRIDNTEANYLEKFKYVLISKKESAIYPTDEAFADAIEHNPNVELSSHFTRNENAFQANRQIDENLYIWTGIDTQYKQNVLRKLFSMQIGRMKSAKITEEGDFEKNKSTYICFM